MKIESFKARAVIHGVHCYVEFVGGVLTVRADREYPADVLTVAWVESLENDPVGKTYRAVSGALEVAALAIAKPSPSPVMEMAGKLVEEFIEKPASVGAMPVTVPEPEPTPAPAPVPVSAAPPAATWGQTTAATSPKPAPTPPAAPKKPGPAPKPKAPSAAVPVTLPHAPDLAPPPPVQSLDDPPIPFGAPEPDPWQLATPSKVVSPVLVSADDVAALVSKHGIDMAVLGVKTRANDVFSYLIRRNVPKDEFKAVCKALQPSIPGIRKIERIEERAEQWLATYDDQE